jgi:hypothetical protein
MPTIWLSREIAQRSVAVGRVLHLRERGQEDDHDARGGQQTDPHLGENALQPAGSSEFGVRLREGHGLLPSME